MSNRAYAFTWNNYEEKDIEYVLSLPADYIIIGLEVGELNTPHLQGYIYKKSKMTFNGLKKKLPKCHIEEAKGSPQQNKTYCSKDKKFFETGECPSQGKRSDLDEVKNTLVSQKTSVEEIIMENPMTYHLYGRTLEKIEDIMNRKKFRTTMTTCTWYYGKTDTGKSHKAYENFNPETHYNWKDDKGWWEGYKQQDIVIINEFRGEIPYRNLLKLIDKHPYEVIRRNREPIPFTSKHIIITSSLPPQEIFHNLAENDSLEQLFRRIQIIELKEKYTSNI